MRPLLPIRRISAVLLALVALLMQTIAPVTAVRAMAASSASDVAGAICAYAGAGQQHKKLPDHAPAKGCPVCQTCCISHFMLPVVAPILPQPQLVGMPARQFVAAHAPRGPPYRRSRARDPPSPV